MNPKKTKKLSKKKRDALIADVFEARRDLSGLAEAHRMSPDELAQWIGQEANQRCLAGLCLLADLQTQLMLSRFRQVAVTELIKQASGGEAADGTSASLEQSRKACVDLLKADLKRAEVAPAPGSELNSFGDGLSPSQEIASIRAALFGTPGNETTTPGSEASAPGSEAAPPGCEPGDDQA